jgi:propanol-preferring alcohol dehydrogenase
MTSHAIMRAMILDSVPGELREAEVARPVPGRGEVLLRVLACGVCRTDLHVVDGDLNEPKLPLIPGHEVVGVVEELGEGVEQFTKGQRVGVPWLGRTCGRCSYCRRGRENLCDLPRFTGYTLDGGYAEWIVSNADYTFALPDGYSDVEAAPLLCAGLIGYRSLVLAGDGQRLGLYGFGAAAHLVAQVARFEGREVFAFTSPGDHDAQTFALDMGCVWAGDSDARSPEELDAAIIFAPVGSLVPLALQNTAKGGVVVCGGIHMSDIPKFPYSLLWGERVVCSVANLTRQDAEEFLALAPRVPVRCTVEPYPLTQANEALSRLRSGELTGAAVLVPDQAMNRLA